MVYVFPKPTFLPKSVKRPKQVIRFTHLKNLHLAEAFETWSWGRAQQ